MVSKEMKVHQSHVNLVSFYGQSFFKFNYFSLSLIFSKMLRQISMSPGLELNLNKKDLVLKSLFSHSLSFYLKSIPLQSFLASAPPKKKVRKNETKRKSHTNWPIQSPGRLPRQFLRQSLDISEFLLRLM